MRFASTARGSPTGMSHATGLASWPVRALTAIGQNPASGQGRSSSRPTPRDYQGQGETVCIGRKHPRYQRIVTWESAERAYPQR